MAKPASTNCRKDISRVLRDKARLRRDQLKASKPKGGFRPNAPSAHELLAYQKRAQGGRRLGALTP